MLKKLGIVLMTLLMMTGLSGCSQTEETNEVKEYGIGETAIYDEVAYTVTHIEKSQGSEYDQPGEGKEYVIVSVKIENQSDETKDYNELYFKILNEQGQVDDVAITLLDQDQNLGSGELIAGGWKEGTLTYLVNQDEELKLYLYADIFSEEPTVIFSLT